MSVTLVTKMAVTRFWSRLLIVFLASISKHKWYSTVQLHDMERHGIKEFMLSTPLAPKGRNSTSCQPNDSRLRSNIPSLFYILLLLGGDIELNPGDKWPPYGICSKQVKPNQEGIQCDQCNSCFHLIFEMCNILKNSLCVWLCTQCDKPNQLNSFLYGSLGSLCSTNSLESLNELGDQIPVSNRSHVNHNKNQYQPKQNGMSCFVKA